MCVQNKTAEKYCILGWSKQCYKFSTLNKDGPDNYKFQKGMWLGHFLWVIMQFLLWNLLGNLRLSHNECRQPESMKLDGDIAHYYVECGSLYLCEIFEGFGS